MRKLPAFCVIVAAPAAYASNCPSGDAMLKNNTPLNQLCPNGFTSKSGGSIAVSYTHLTLPTKA